MKRQKMKLILLQLIFCHLSQIKINALGGLLIGSTTAEVGPTGLRALKPGEGVESVQGFCRGLNALDEFGDIATQLMNRKFPRLGPFRVSC